MFNQIYIYKVRSFFAEFQIFEQIFSKKLLNSLAH